MQYLRCTVFKPEKNIFKAEKIHAVNFVKVFQRINLGV